MSPLQALRHLPRDARDTLFQLAVIGWTVLPHIAHLPIWCGGMVVLILAWRARLALGNAPLPRRWVVAAVLTLAMALTVYSEGTLLGRDAGVTMLVVLMALKTLELRARRDAMVVFFLGFFLVLTHFLYSQSLLVALSMVLSVWGLLTALALAHMPVGRPPLMRAGAVAAKAALYGAPVMVALFVLFPRLGPLWGMPQDSAGRTGLSGTLRMGGVAEVANDETVALRVRFSGRVPTQDELYFRGPVLSTFDGREWTRVVPSFPPNLRPRSEIQLIGAPIAYEITLEPNRLPLLPLLEMTPDRGDAAPEIEGWTLTLRPDAQWQVDRPVSERLRVQAKAWPQHRHGPRQEILGLRDFVTLPAGYNPRALAWAAALRARPEYARANARTLAQALLDQIRGGGYTYTLEPGAYGRDAIDEFWFDRKLGFCEHFAASFVVMMRAMDVPARIVTGYQGADAQPVDGYHIVRQSNAHAWAEYWQAGEGWIRTDPTAAVAPERINAGRSLPPARGFVAGALGNVNPALAAELRQVWEAANNRWNQWVLNYSRGQQFTLLKDLGVQTPGWQDLAYALIGLLCSASLAGAAWALWDRHRQDPWVRLQRRIAERLGELGVVVLPHDPPRTRAQRVRGQLGDRGQALAQELDALDRQRYGHPAWWLPDRGWWQRFSAAASALQGKSP